MNLYIVSVALESDTSSHQWDRYLVANERPSYDELLRLINEYRITSVCRKIIAISHIGAAQAHVLPGVLLCEDGVY